MAHYSDWAYIGSQPTEDSQMAYGFQNMHTQEIQIVVMAFQDDEISTFGDLLERLLEQIGETHWEGDFVDMLLNRREL